MSNVEPITLGTITGFGPLETCNLTGEPSSTLPIPIPIGQAAAKNVSVHGVSGLFVGDSTGLGSAVLWQQNGLVYVVGGTLTEAEVLAVANSLR